MTVGLAIAAGGLAWLTQIGVQSDFWVHVAPQEILMSVGLGLAFPAFSSTALTRVRDRDAGVASALVNTTQQAGSTMGAALINTIAVGATASYLAVHGHSATAQVAGSIHGYTTAFLFSAIVLAVAAVSAFALIRAPKVAVDEEAELLAVPVI